MVYLKLNGFLGRVVVVGATGLVGETMIKHPDVAAISFTGSVPTGRGVAAKAISSTPMKKVQLEMGGKNAVIVLDAKRDQVFTASFESRDGTPAAREEAHLGDLRSILSRSPG